MTTFAKLTGPFRRAGVWALTLFLLAAFQPVELTMANDELTLVGQSGAGKLFNTGDDLIQVMQLEGTWFEMGQQYGTFAKDGMQQVWDVTVQPVIDKKEMTENEALSQFGQRVFASSSHRMQQLYRGVADATGWSVDKVALVGQSAVLGVYQSKIHSFAGCSSLLAWGEATKSGGMITARNMDWGEAFLKFPLYLTVYKPTDGSQAVANLGWPGWLWAMTMINENGVYVDLHDGTSMGGSVVFADRPSFLNSVFDMMVECNSADAISHRFNATRTDFASIWTVADDSPTGFSFENAPYDSRRRNPTDGGDTLAVVNTFLNPDWGMRQRDTVSNSLTRYRNLTDRAADAHGSIDAEKAMELFDLTLFNLDGTFRENGGPTKPTKQDADVTCHQIVTDLKQRQVWIKIPLKTQWRHVDLSSLFQSGE
ncbi:MAG: C45 family autoproteolytic acyltransferase/hydrolase [Pirellulaceae bacterium]